jgi:hypothetical protein
MGCAWLEPKARVIPRCPFQEDERDIAFAQQFDAAADQRRSDPLVLTLRNDPDRAQHLHREQALRRVEQARTEHHVPDNLVSFCRDERQPFASPDSVAQLVDEVCNDRDVIFSERRDV